MPEENRLVAVKTPDESEAQYLVERMVDQGFGADVFEREGTWYARITELYGTDIEDALFEMSWRFGRDAGTIPDTRPATPTENP